jgi:hypothetical protein
MADTESRYKAAWYNKRIRNNSVIKQFLINVIETHKEKDFPFVTDDLYYLNYEDLFEIAVATVNKTIGITLGAGSDWSDNKDGKFSIVRTNSYGRSYSGLVNCRNKTYIRFMCYEEINNAFYFFNFPLKKFKGATLKEFSVPFDTVTGLPKEGHWSWSWKANSFEEMALAS